MNTFSELSMANTSCNWENLQIYLFNLSPVYFFCSVATFFALFLTCRFNAKNSRVCNSDPSFKKITRTTQMSPSRRKRDGQRGFKENTSLKHKPSSPDTFNRTSDHNTIKYFKSIEQAVIEKELTARISGGQLLKEEEIQASQLEAIFKVLKENEDQFHIRSMDELQEQLKLYKSC